MKIEVVDDDPDLAGLIGYALRQAGYLVVEAADGEKALEVFAREAPDLVILDVNLPKLSGLEVCRRLRADPHPGAKVPIMMLTVRNAEEDEVAGLDAGADDYLTKPFSPRALLARVRALLRRSDAVERPQPLAAGHFTLDLEHQSVAVAGSDPTRLTPLELRLLQLLLVNAGAALPAERLLRHVWGARGEGDRQLLKQLVHRLRLKIEADAGAPRYLVTLPGLGYALRPEGEGEVG